MAALRRALALAALVFPAVGDPEAGRSADRGGADGGETCAAGAGGQGCAAAAAGSPAALWPRARGHLGSYGVVANLSGPSRLPEPSLTWTPGKTRYHDTVLGGPLIDAKGNFYVTSINGVHKVSPAGQRLWSFTLGAPVGYAGSLNPDGTRLFSVDQAGTAFALDTETGQSVWTQSNGMPSSSDTAYVENHDGVVIFQKVSARGVDASDVVHALSEQDGHELWQFRPDNPVWNLMAMFPEDGTVVFQDHDAKTYRLFLHNGSVIWKAGGGHTNKQTWTDGGCILGNNGVVYSVSSKAQVVNHHHSTGGGVHAYNLTDGSLLWQRLDLQRPVFTWPVVGKLAGRSDSSVVVSVGANGYFPWIMIIYEITPLFIFLGFLLGSCYEVFRCVCCCRSCPTGLKHSLKRIVVGVLVGLVAFAVVLALYIYGRVFVPVGFFKAEVYAFNAMTGEQQWVYKLPDWNHRYSKGDWEGYHVRRKEVPARSMCLPAAFNSPTVDADGVVFIGYMDGVLYALKDTNGDGVVQGDDEVSQYDTGGAFLHSGAAIVPGKMAVTNCEQLFVWDL